MEDPKPTIVDIADDEDDGDRGNDLMRWRNKVAHGPLPTERVEAVRQDLLDLNTKDFGDFIANVKSDKSFCESILFSV